MVCSLIDYRTDLKIRWIIRVARIIPRITRLRRIIRPLGWVLRWLNTVLAVSEYRSFAKLWQEKGCSSQAETWQVKNILMKEFD